MPLSNGLLPDSKWIILLWFPPKCTIDYVVKNDKREYNQSRGVVF